MSEYNKDSIKVLDDVEHIKLRRSMYIGDAHDPRQLISEMIDNALDEVQNGYSTHLEVYVDTNKNEYRVRDYGRGIPHGIKTLETGEKKEILEIVCTKSNSGGKFDNASYRNPVGLHGLGLTVTNALSNYFRITSFRNKKSVTLLTSKGIKKDILYEDTEQLNGTEVAFIPDKDIFRSNVIPQEYIITRCRVASALGFRAELYLDGNRIDTNATIFDLITEDEENVSTYHQFGPIEVNTKDKERMIVALRYTSETNDRYFGYTNLLFNNLGGTHVQELNKTLISIWRDYIDTNKKYKPETDLRPSDYLVGLRGVCAVFISKPEFSSQTKEKLTVPKNYFNEIMQVFRERLVDLFNKNPIIVQALIKRFEEYRISQNKLLARKEISSLIKVNNDDPSSIRRRSVVPKLIECTSKNRHNTELFLVEGDSAAGPAARARNKELQAVLPLRGKILNVTNMDPSRAVKSQEVCNIVNSIGCGIGSRCDSSKSRYDRVIISSDADPDGLQITCLVLSVFINMLPDLVKDGRLYIAEPPLYGWRDKSGYHYTNVKDEIPNGLKFTRYKGLGEMDDNEFEYCCMNPKTRQLVQVEYPSDINAFNRILGTSVGKAELFSALGMIKDIR